MKTEKNILLAFFLNLGFSVFELFGGFFTGSIAILSDALHDFGDALSIGLSYFLEKKSRKQPDDIYTYGYARYSALGGFVTAFILLMGSCYVISRSVYRFFHPVPVHYDGMLIFAMVGVLVNLIAAFFTRHGESVNQKAVNLHMLEDVLGWAVVLVGSVLIRFTDFTVLDPLMSIGVSVFILIHAIEPIKETMNLFLMKVPEGIHTEKIREQLSRIDGVLDIHHLRIFSIDGRHHNATLHIVVEDELLFVKERIRQELKQYGIIYVNIEPEGKDEPCEVEEFRFDFVSCGHHH